MAETRPTKNDGGKSWLTRERVLPAIFVVLTIAVVVLCFRITKPFVPALTWAIALAIVAQPLHALIMRYLRNSTGAAMATVAVVVITLMVPAVFVVTQVTRQAVASVQNIENKAGEQAENGRWRDAIERNPRFAPVLKWVDRELDIEGEIKQFAESLVKNATQFVSGSFYVVIGWLVTMFLLFYFLRDRQQVLSTVRGLLPLTTRESNLIFREIRDTTQAVVQGTLTVSAVQGTMGGLMFWALGLPAPALWAAVMALLSTLPVMGAAMIWLPAAIFLALEGSWEKALILTAWGGIAIALIDNFLYPHLVKNKMNFHAVPVFISVMGGLFVFGAAGVVLGPVILAVAAALLTIWRARLDAEVV